MKYLVAGLGNIGNEYAHTRHNIGFDILDALAGASNISFKDKRYGMVSEMKYRARTYVLLKPSTFMNLSGNAIRYWLKKEKLPMENLLVVVDDLALPFGTLRLRAKGGDAGHNGLNHIQTIMGTTNYARLRFGVGNDFYSGQQVDYVLSGWTEEQEKALPDRIEMAGEIIKSFGVIGLQRTMNVYNNK
ncbi:MAG: aminoacyl-tRNA hydrolase [Bacteroidetes bacterium]|nr:MAG: aminoacyl-tRNA hydrolase [Bacteroidota bacterium]RLD93251.1 MAG: aminoacyl-tRNA hydrolase [Bacteroidota bacterium]RLE05662.1 MAG: aminoacyl-tRNA hydrolase [Bacteroidota bacterium]